MQHLLENMVKDFFREIVLASFIQEDRNEMMDRHIPRGWDKILTRFGDFGEYSVCSASSSLTWIHFCPNFSIYVSRGCQTINLWHIHLKTYYHSILRDKNIYCLVHVLSKSHDGRVLMFWASIQTFNNIPC